MKKILAFLFLFSFCFACQSKPHFYITKISQAEFSALVDEEENSNQILKDSELDEEKIEEEKISSSFIAMQLDVKVFEPQDKNYYDAVLPNNSFSFIAYKNNCEIFFDASGIKSFTCFLNDVQIKTDQICENGFVKVNVSSLVKNGRNIIYVSNIEKKHNSARLKIRIPYPTLQKTKAKIEGINYEVLEFLDEILKSQVENNFPSLQILIAKDGTIIKNDSYGKIFDDKRFAQNKIKAPKVTNETLYDIASNTKMYATILAIQRLVFLKKISIHDKITKFFPDFADEKKAKYTGKAEMTIEHLITHSSGFPAGGAYYSRKPVKSANDKTRREKVLEQILKTRLINNVGEKVVYSDVNFMLLSFIVEEVTKMPFDKFLEKEIYTPLNLTRICFDPLSKGFSTDEIAATEIGLDRSKTGETYQGFAHGHVHDPEAFLAMNEVSGHAGLFANAESLAVLAQTMINGGGYGGIKLFSKNIVNVFLSYSQYAPSYSLGWRAQANDSYKWAFSTYASPHSFGHTGWTGTFTMFDVENNLIIIILTNSKHTDFVSRMKSEGDYFLVRDYGAITSIIYSAFGQYDIEYFASIITEIAKQKFNLIKTESRFRNNGAYNNLASIMQIIKKHKLKSKTLRDFLKSETASEIDDLLKGIQ
ncbi:MAG: serine hydrolase [Treponemataceae bacterium]